MCGRLCCPGTPRRRRRRRMTRGPCRRGRAYAGVRARAGSGRRTRRSTCTRTTAWTTPTGTAPAARARPLAAPAPACACPPPRTPHPPQPSSPPAPARTPSPLHPPAPATRDPRDPEPLASIPQACRCSFTGRNAVTALTLNPLHIETTLDTPRIRTDLTSSLSSAANRLRDLQREEKRNSKNRLPTKHNSPLGKWRARYLEIDGRHWASLRDPIREQVVEKRGRMVLQDPVEGLGKELRRQLSRHGCRRSITTSFFTSRDR